MVWLEKCEAGESMRTVKGECTEQLAAGDWRGA